MALAPDDLVLHAGTCQHRSFAEYCETAVAGGFDAITIYRSHVEGAARDGLTLPEMGALARDHGLSIADLDAVLDWLPGTTAPPGFDGNEAFFYRVHDAIGGTSLNLGSLAPETPELSQAADALAALCERAASRGLFVTLEYLPWTGIADAATAYEIIRRSGRDDATLMFDAWHTFRGPTDDEQLRAIPGRAFGAIQLDDAPEEAAENLVVESITQRLLPGEGAAPLPTWLGLLRDAGCRAPVGVEVFSNALDALSPQEAGRRLGASTRSVMAAAQETRAGR